MTDHPTMDQLEAVALGEAESPEAVAHVERCDACARELAWLRAEAELVRRRPQPRVDPQLWHRIDERIHAPIPITRARRWRALAGAALAVAAAAALAIVVRPQRPVSRGGRSDGTSRSRARSSSSTAARRRATISTSE
jgi:anti-sigma factor ChrR (cupin superfamily)